MSYISTCSANTRVSFFGSAFSSLTQVGEIPIPQIVSNMCASLFDVNSVDTSPDGLNIIEEVWVERVREGVKGRKREGGRQAKIIAGTGRGREIEGRGREVLVSPSRGSLPLGQDPSVPSPPP
jgi:hypothetical protein